MSAAATGGTGARDVTMNSSTRVIRFSTRKPIRPTGVLLTIASMYDFCPKAINTSFLVSIRPVRS